VRSGSSARNEYEIISSSPGGQKLNILRSRLS